MYNLWKTKKTICIREIFGIFIPLKMNNILKWFSIKEFVMSKNTAWSFNLSISKYYEKKIINIM